MSLHVTGSNLKGEAYLVLTQGDVEETINLTGSFNSPIDLSRFVPGGISMCFIYEEAGETKVDVHLEINKETKTGQGQKSERRCETCTQNVWHY